ncbi:MAG: Ig domain-containing protein [Bacteroidales bacterium]|nr:Ig domain-containing protein [Bacteroidales bacterium]
MKQKMYLSFGALLLGAMTVQAQSSVVAGGCDASNPQGAAMGITVGQLAVETFSKSSGSVLLGIQQDYSVVESAVATNPIPDIEVPKDGEAGSVNLEDYFVTDSKLDYSATSTDDAIVKPLLDGMNLTFVLGKPGTVTITVVATNVKGEKTTLSFSITVEGDEDVRIPTAIDEIANEPMISVVGYTVYISNMNGEPCAVYDISGKCVYSCRDMMNATVIMRTVGTYIVKIGNKQQNVVIK